MSRCPLPSIAKVTTTDPPSSEDSSSPSSVLVNEASLDSKQVSALIVCEAVAEAKTVVKTVTAIHQVKFPNKETFQVPRWSPMFAMHGYMWSIVVRPVADDAATTPQDTCAGLQVGLLLQSGSLHQLPKNARLHCTFDVMVNHKVEGLSTVTERAQARGVHAILQQAKPRGRVVSVPGHDASVVVVTENAPLAIGLSLCEADLKACCCLDAEQNIHVTVVMAEPPTVVIEIDPEPSKVPIVSRDLDNWDFMEDAQQGCTSSTLVPSTGVTHGCVHDTPVSVIEINRQSNLEALQDEWYPLQNNKTCARMYACVIYTRGGGGAMEESRNADLVLLTHFFTEMGWDFDVFPVSTAMEINGAMVHVMNKDYASYDSMSLYLTGSGKQNCMELPGDQSLFHVGVDTLRGYLSSTLCPTLINKPKLIFVQSSRDRWNAPEDKLTDIYSSGPGVSGGGGGVATNFWCNALAVQQGQRAGFNDSKDFIVMYACTPCSTAWTNTIAGSWLFDILATCWQESFRTQDVHSMLLDVARCINRRTLTIKYVGVQVPEIISTFTHRLRLSTMVLSPPRDNHN
jgi:hypothetical protein